MEYEVTEYVGIDVSKDDLDYCGEHQGSGKVSNDEAGFFELEELLDHQSCVVMESTGAYHMRLAMHLHERGYMVAVLNPFVINRYVQMKLERNKTDKGDARMICDYAIEHGVELWEPLPDYLEECKSNIGVLELLMKQRTQLKNKKHYLQRKGGEVTTAMDVLVRQISELDEMIYVLESDIVSMIKEEESELYTCLKSIPGMGPRTVMSLIIQTNGLRGFENAKQLSSYIGMAPTERSSGTSVRGSGKISKMGNAKMRYHLFMCAFTACKCNPACKSLYERLVNKGKSKKLALVAVANKLLKQAFAISQSRIPFDPEYRSAPPSMKC